MKTKPPQLEQLLQKVEELKKTKTFDLSREEDLSIAIMNLVSLEEHFFFTAEKTKNLEYFDLLKETREIRKNLLARMIDRHEGETWCITKHLLAATMRLMEVGTKYLSEGNKEEAEKLFSQSYRLYSIFWGLRLKLMNIDDVHKIKDESLNVHDSAQGPWKFEDIMNKLVDCCKE